MSSQGSARSGRGLRLLSIGATQFSFTTRSDAASDPDGGGIRGLSPLLMLKEILYRIQQENKLEELPLPCDIFDLAGGTSTGGYGIAFCFRTLD